MEDHRVNGTAPNQQQSFKHTDRFHGYSHPLYRTSNQTYGNKRPSEHERQARVHVTSRQFSEVMLQTGMYRDHGFNTSVETSRVTVSTATHHNRINRQYYYRHGNRS